jgi:hypothetical protein
MEISDTTKAEAIALGERLELIEALFGVIPKYRKWARDPLLSYEKAILLFMGHDPDAVNFNVLTQIDSDPFLKQFLGHKVCECEDIWRRLRLAKKAGLLGQGGSTNRDQLETPSNFLACAEQIELDVADNLVQEHSEHAGRPSYKKLLADRGEMAEALVAKNREITQLSARIRHLEETPFEFDTDSEDYPLELDVGLLAWWADKNGNAGPGSTPKERMAHFIKNSGHDLSPAAIERIAKCANWQKSGGRTPSQEK